MKEKVKIHLDNVHMTVFSVTLGRQAGGEQEGQQEELPEEHPEEHPADSETQARSHN